MPIRINPKAKCISYATDIDGNHYKAYILYIDDKPKIVESDWYVPIRITKTQSLRIRKKYYYENGEEFKDIWVKNNFLNSYELFFETINKYPVMFFSIDFDESKVVEVYKEWFEQNKQNNNI